MKNILARVAAMIERTQGREGGDNDFAQTLRRRIKSMADTHAMLSRTQWHGVTLKQLCDAELGPYKTLSPCTTATGLACDIRLRLD